MFRFNKNNKSRSSINLLSFLGFQNLKNNKDYVRKRQRQILWGFSLSSEILIQILLIYYLAFCF